MKKFYLLLALVLTAGVVHAQGNTPNFGSRANLKQAKRANSRVTGPKTFTWTENNQYYSENGQVVNLFNDVQNSQNIEQGQTMASTYENFVIRVSGLTSDSPYSVEFYDVVKNNGTETEILLKTFTYWKDDVHISPLRAVFTDENEINRIHRVKLKSSCNSGSLTFEEAYFISAYKGLIEKATDINGNEVYAGFLDKNNVDIGNAYIDPSYLIRSNRLWVDPHSDRTFDIVCESGSEVGTLTFSLPYKTGIDLSEVTFTATDFDRTADVMNRFICDNHTVDLQHKEGESGYSAATRDVRKLYNSRYSGSFYDAFNNLALSGVNYYLDSNGVERQAGTLKDSAIMHVNNMYWQAHGFTTTEQRRVFCQDFCLTKNTIKARTTRKGLVSTDWTNPDNEAGFRDKNYPVRPYFKYITDNQGNVILDNEGNPRTEWSDVVRGDWNSSNTYNYTDLSKYNKMRIIGSQNTQFVIRYATSLSSNYHPTYNVPLVEAWKEIKVKTDANGEVNVDLDYLKAKDNSDKFCLQLILFDGIADLVWSGNGEQIGNASTTGGLRETVYVNNIELFEGEGRLVDLVGLNNLEDPNILENMYHVWNNDNNYQWQYATVVGWTCPVFENHIGVAHSTIWGDPSVNPENYADLTGYKKIRIYGPSGQTLRLFYNSMRYGAAPYLNVNAPFVDEGGKENIYYQLENLTTTTENHPNGESYAEFDLSNFEFFHLNSIKASAHNTQATVTAIKLVEDEEADYIFYGNGGYGEQDKTKIDPTVAAATKDLTAKVIDTRARCNNMQVPYEFDIFKEVEHLALPKTANPNVLFIERTNQFRGRFVKYVKFQDPDNIEKDVNLIVPSNKKYDDENPDNSEYFTSNNIELSDGYSFYAPKQINAAQAKYTRTFKNTIDAVNSIILPFAVEAGNTPVTESKFGFYETTETLKSTTAQNSVVGILNEQTANEGDWLIQFQKKTGQTKANKPYLYAVAANTGTKEFTGAKTGDNVIISATPDVKTKAIVNMTNNESETNTFDYYLRGVYESTYIDDILFYGTDGTLYRTPYMTVTPFRTIFKSPIEVINEGWKDSQDAYFTTPASGVKIVLAFDSNDESLDINEVVADGLFAEDEPIYNLAGQRVNTFDKGVYIVGGKKILVK